MMGERGLTEEQRRFVEEYIANGFKDAKNCALRAGYAESVAVNAYREVLGSPTVRKAIDEAKEIFTKAARDRISGHANDAIDALVESLQSNFATSAGAKVSAAKALLEMAGIGQPIRVEHTGKDGGPIEHKIVGALRDRLVAIRGEGGASEASGE